TDEFFRHPNGGRDVLSLSAIPDRRGDNHRGRTAATLAKPRGPRVSSHDAQGPASNPFMTDRAESCPQHDDHPAFRERSGEHIATESPICMIQEVQPYPRIPSWMRSTWSRRKRGHQNPRSRPSSLSNTKLRP